MMNSTARCSNQGTSASSLGSYRLLPRVNGSSAVPLHLQVSSMLIEAIRRGIFLPGSRLPSTVDIARQVRVSLLTAHRALQELTRQGWLERGRGHGTLVRVDFQAAQAAAPRFRILLAMSGAPEPHNASVWPCLAGILAAAAQIVPPTERVIHHYTSAAELQQIKTDGILCLQPRLQDIPALEEIGRLVPTVLVGASSLATSLPCVGAAEQESTQLAVRHLVELGHRRIALVEPGHSPTAGDRLCGFMREMGTSGLQIQDHDVLNLASHGAGSAGIAGGCAGLEQRLMHLTRRPNAPTAIIAGDLALALGIRSLLQAAGSRIPEHLSLISLGDDWFAEYMTPAITAVAYPMREMARHAYSRLLQRLSGQAAGDSQLLSPSLVVRGTTAPPPNPPGRTLRRSPRKQVDTAVCV